jgi:hypothetical protein
MGKRKRAPTRGEAGKTLSAERGEGPPSGEAEVGPTCRGASVKVKIEEGSGREHRTATMQMLQQNPLPANSQSKEAAGARKATVEANLNPGRGERFAAHDCIPKSGEGAK